MRNQLYSKAFIFLIFSFILLFACNPTEEDGWIELFNGKDLTGWKASENPSTFTVSEGTIVAEGPRAHLYYEGEHLGNGFKDFEMELDVMTHRLANSGIFFHTEFIQEGWPAKGREVQVNNTHPGEGDFKELKKTGSLYSVRNLYKAMAQDSVWFRIRFIVQGKQLQVWVNDVNTVNYTQSVNPLERGLNPRDTFSNGTIALQGHDPLSKVKYKNIRIRRLTDVEEEVAAVDYNFGDWYPEMMSKKKNQFPFIDLNVPIQDYSEVESLLQFYYQSGVNIGLVAPPDSLGSWKEKCSAIPVFLGAKVSDNTEPAIEADYRIGSVALPDLSEGSDVTQQFMTSYTEKIKQFLESGRADVWSGVTQLPEALADQYDALWTPEVVGPLLELAAQKGIAIEIDNQSQLPSLAVLKLAKAYGCTFSYSGISSNEMNNKSSYFLEVLDSCQLGYKNMYVPLWED